MFCFLVAGVLIAMAMEWQMASQEEPQRLERVRGIAEVVNEVLQEQRAEAIARQAMQAYDARWTRVVDNAERAIVRWTRFMLWFRVVDLHEMRNKETLCEFGRED